VYLRLKTAFDLGVWNLCLSVAEFGLLQIHASVWRRPMSFLRELWRYMRTRKKYWLLPILIVMVILGGLIVLAQGSAVAPFIYTLF
jgi:hypothetical protein